MIDFPINNVGTCLGKQTEEKTPKHLYFSPAMFYGNCSFTKVFCLFLLSGLVHSAGDRQKSSSSKSILTHFPTTFLFPPCRGSCSAPANLSSQIYFLAKFSISSKTCSVFGAYIQGEGFLCQVRLESRKTLRDNMKEKCDSRINED